MACSAGTPARQFRRLAAGTRRVVQVVAAENFWGSIVSQIGGVHAHVVSLITNPNTDPHSYEPTAADARWLAGSQMVVENGVGYDPWVDKLLSADPAGIVTLDVGAVLGLADGDNPHRWYNPADVHTVIGADDRRPPAARPGGPAYFAAQQHHFETVALAPYDADHRHHPGHTPAPRSGPPSRSSPCWPPPSVST